MSTSPQGQQSSAPPANEPPPARAAERPRTPWALLVLVALLAAALAALGSYLAVQAADDGQTVAEAPADGGTSEDTNGAAVPLSAQQDWSSIADQVGPSVVSINVAGQLGVGSGSGVVWDTEGHIVTNAHVVEGGQALQVTTSDGWSYSASVVGTDPSSDLAVIQLNTIPDGLTPISPGDDDALSVGEPVMAVGNPLGLSGTVTTGIVSALNRPVATVGLSGPLVGQVVTNAIQTSAPINPGNSGGALVNETGELIGINTAIASIPAPGQTQAGSIGIGFAIPTSKVELIAPQLIETGTAEHAFLGVGLSDGQAETQGAAINGAQVEQVESGSPADEAGLQTGDLIITIDGDPVQSAVALVGQVRERASGEEAVLEYVRDGERAETTVTLATRPDPSR